MSIKIAHTHEDGKVCFLLDRNYTDAGFHEINGVECLIGYRGYTGHWYCFDPKTGREIANFSREFYESCIKHYRVSDLIKDPDCV